MPGVKFCGLTRAADARLAADCGASYAGVIFAGGPRLLNEERALEVLATLPAQVRRVGVFGEQRVEEIAAMASAVRLDVVQLHRTTTPAELRALRHEMAAAVEPVDLWAVVRVAGGELPEGLDELSAAADAIVIDSLVPGALGGTGVAADWQVLSRSLAGGRRPRCLILAGGLTPDNVSRAIALVAPDVVDVSSGVEASPGIKDPARMRAFALAADSTIPRHHASS